MISFIYLPGGHRNINFTRKKRIDRTWKKYKLLIIVFSYFKTNLILMQRKTKLKL